MRTYDIVMYVSAGCSIVSYFVEALSVLCVVGLLGTMLSMYMELWSKYKIVRR